MCATVPSLSDYFSCEILRSRITFSWPVKGVWFNCVSLSEGQVKQEAAMPYQLDHCLRQLDKAATDSDMADSAVILSIPSRDLPGSQSTASQAQQLLKFTYMYSKAQERHKPAPPSKTHACPLKSHLCASVVGMMAVGGVLGSV